MNFGTAAPPRASPRIRSRVFSRASSAGSGSPRSVIGNACNCWNARHTPAAPAWQNRSRIHLRDPTAAKIRRLRAIAADRDETSSTTLVTSHPPPRRATSRTTLDQPTLFRFVALSMLLHLWIVVLFGTTTYSPSRRSGEFGDALNVDLRALRDERGSAFRLAPGADTAAPGSALLPRPDAAAARAARQARDAAPARDPAAPAPPPATSRPESAPAQPAREPVPAPAASPPATEPRAAEALPRLNPDAPEETDRPLQPAPSPVAPILAVSGTARAAVDPTRDGHSSRRRAASGRDADRARAARRAPNRGARSDHAGPAAIRTARGAAASSAARDSHAAGGRNADAFARAARKRSRTRARAACAADRADASRRAPSGTGGYRASRRHSARRARGARRAPRTRCAARATRRPADRCAADRCAGCSGKRAVATQRVDRHRAQTRGACCAGTVPGATTDFAHRHGTIRAATPALRRAATR